MIGEEIRELRAKAGLSLRKAARRLGVSRSLLSMIERGRATVSDRLAARLDEALSCGKEMAKRLRILAAIDRGTIDLCGVDDEEVVADAIDRVDGARDWGVWMREEGEE